MVRSMFMCCQGPTNLSIAGDDTVFDDLGIDAKQYAQVPTTWD
jgi:hypothetical protein